MLPRNCSLEKNEVPRELALIAISLACLNEIHLVEAENKLPYCLSYLGLSSCCLPFVSVFLHMCTNNCIHLIVKILYITTLVFFYLSWDLSWRRVSFLKGDLQFSKLFKNTICRGLCTLKCTEKRFIPFTGPPFSPLICPPYRILRKEALNMPTGMYSVIRFSEIMRHPAFILSILLGSDGRFSLGG